MIRAAPIFLGEEVATGVASRLGMRLGRDTTIRLGEQARPKIDRLLVDAGGEMTLRSEPLLFDRPPSGASAAVQIRSPFALIYRRAIGESWSRRRRWVKRSEACFIRMRE